MKKMLKKSFYRAKVPIRSRKNCINCSARNCIALAVTGVTVNAPRVKCDDDLS